MSTRKGDVTKADVGGRGQPEQTAADTWPCRRSDTSLCGVHRGPSHHSAQSHIATAEVTVPAGLTDSSWAASSCRPFRGRSGRATRHNLANGQGMAAMPILSCLQGRRKSEVSFTSRISVPNTWHAWRNRACVGICLCPSTHTCSHMHIYICIHIYIYIHIPPPCSIHRFSAVPE